MGWRAQLREFRDWDPRLAEAICEVLDAAEDEMFAHDLPDEHPLRRAFEALELIVNEED